jgi:hypothetical protein
LEADSADLLSGVARTRPSIPKRALHRVGGATVKSSGVV